GLAFAGQVLLGRAGGWKVLARRAGHRQVLARRSGNRKFLAWGSRDRQFLLRSAGDGQRLPALKLGQQLPEQLLRFRVASRLRRRPVLAFELLQPPFDLGPPRPEVGRFVRGRGAGEEEQGKKRRRQRTAWSVLTLRFERNAALDVLHDDPGVGSEQERRGHDLGQRFLERARFGRREDAEHGEQSEELRDRRCPPFGRFPPGLGHGCLSSLVRRFATCVGSHGPTVYSRSGRTRREGGGAPPRRAPAPPRGAGAPPPPPPRPPP